MNYVHHSGSVEGDDLNHLVEGNQAGLFRRIGFERITRPYPLTLTTQKHFVHTKWASAKHVTPGGPFLCPRVII